MKRLLYITVVILVSIYTSQAQTIVSLTGPIGGNHYLKDLDGVRANFVGTWRYSSGNKEFILHIYNWDMKSQGNWWGQGEYWRDALVGNYIYKENGVEIINTTPYLTDLNNITNAPFWGITRDGIELYWRSSGIVDYGAQSVNGNCETYNVHYNVGMQILNYGNGNPLVAKMILTGKNKIIINHPCATPEPPSTFPEVLQLVKISNTPPPLN